MSEHISSLCSLDDKIVYAIGSEICCIPLNSVQATGVNTDGSEVLTFPSGHVRRITALRSYRCTATDAVHIISSSEDGTAFVYEVTPAPGIFKADLSYPTSS